MPVAANPHSREYYVYTMRAEGHPFYVGIGRDKRASDRVRWVQSQIARELRGLPAKWVRHTCVIRRLLEANIAVKSKTHRANLNRAEALTFERELIQRLKRRGIVLANHHHNADCTLDADQIVADLKERISRSA